MAQFDSYEAQNLIETSIGYMLNDDRDDLINLLRQNGVNVSDNVSDDDLLNMTYVAIGRSTQFKRDLAKYLDAQSKGETTLNYVDGEFFNLFGGKKKSSGGTPAPKKPKVSTADKQKARITDANPSGKTKAGLLLGQIGTTENIQAAINTGLGVLSQKLTAKADQKSIADATALASERSKQAAAEAEAADKKAAAGDATRKWVVPVVIGVSVVAVIVGVVIYMKRNKA
jgi:hypothetical protein